MKQKRFSLQRERIFQVVQATEKHPTAQEVYEILKSEMPKLSLGTVYRNLHQLAEEGALMELEGPQARFDANIWPHTHFRCMSCGAVNDLKNIPYDAQLDAAAQEAGGRIFCHNLLFTGICPDCTGKEIQNM